MLMALLALLLFVVIASLILWAAQQFVTDPMILKVIRVAVVVVCVIAAVLFIADMFGISTGLPRMR